VLLCLVDVTNWHSIPMELIYDTKLTFFYVWKKVCNQRLLLLR